ncbi:DNA polymerase delta subunit 3 [Eufriesea mexicana]|uniref:DNA polymerase delta subunit 3 n=1 Tax=Eufriesea mexicana TaxID=516756 RepID=A0A310SLR3_9HYME|nr:PREDICTED: DNA polymerase delta subunit 3-like [Eufriesea mexicana]OAD62084.1 DNA polymerase delta subunit 3 [Eufriesea mexicana]
MFLESLHKYLDIVAGYIFDEDKVVTYKWLSKELEVHVNISKQILWEFWHKYKEEKDFDCTFLLMGILHDNGMRIEVVRSKDLLTAKEKYSKIICKHIYSLQKVLPEIQILGNVENGDIKFSAIKCIENNERSDEEMHIFRWNARSNENKPVLEEKVQSISKTNKVEKENSSEEKQIVKKKNAERKGFDNLFGKASNKQKDPSVPPSSEKMEVVSFDQTKQPSKDVTLKFSKSIKQKDGLSNFLQPSKNQTKIVETVDEDKISSSIEKKITEKTTTLKNNDKQKKTVRGKKRTRSKETNNTVKKRKRITICSDSSGTELSDKEQEQELELPPSPENSSFIRKRSVSPPQVKHENGKRKILKIVDKTFEEDGFLVTKKVHVYKSCSEDESETIEAKEPIVPESRSEVKGKKNSKQTSLTSFFKKL